MCYRKYLSLSRRRLSFFILPLIVVSLIFILYQIFIFMQIPNEYKNPSMLLRVRGTHIEQNTFYQANAQNKFLCIRSLEEIDFTRVNDDYCDCLDASDEPGTNACSNGIFYCRNQKYLPKWIHSSKVNDGICDCCDGSDEWKNNALLHNFDRSLQKQMHKYHPPCPNIC